MTGISLFDSGFWGISKQPGVETEKLGVSAVGKFAHRLSKASSVPSSATTDNRREQTGRGSFPGACGISKQTRRERARPSDCELRRTDGRTAISVN